MQANIRKVWRRHLWTSYRPYGDVARALVRSRHKESAAQASRARSIRGRPSPAGGWGGFTRHGDRVGGGRVGGTFARCLAEQQHAAAAARLLPGPPPDARPASMHLTPPHPAQAAPDIDFNQDDAFSTIIQVRRSVHAACAPPGQHSSCTSHMHMQTCGQQPPTLLASLRPSLCLPCLPVQWLYAKMDELGAHAPARASRRDSK